jgi:transcriptional regulator with XRE-family HTH domain
MRSTLYSPINKQVSKLFKNARLEAGITQKQLAKATGRTQAYISKFENGQLRLDIEDFIRFCDAIGLDASNVVTELIMTPTNLSE